MNRSSVTDASTGRANPNALPDPEKIHSETDHFRYTGDSFRKVVVRGDTVGRWYDDNGVMHIDVLDFLLDSGSI